MKLGKKMFEKNVATKLEGGGDKALGARLLKSLFSVQNYGHEIRFSGANVNLNILNFVPRSFTT